MKTRVCSRCKTKKPLEDFHRNRRNKDGYDWWCKECNCAYQKELYRRKHPLREKRMATCHPERPHRAKGLCKQCYYKRYWGSKQGYVVCRRKKLKSYGLTIEEYVTIFESQNGSCAICGKPPKRGRWSLCVDHDHKTEEIRGLLCYQCNLILGNAGDSPEILQKAIEYLERNEEAKCEKDY